MARPSKYKKEFAKQAVKLCELGATNALLADFFDVSERTIERWSVEKQEFCRALRIGKDSADDKVERSLYERALGYSHPDVHISSYLGAITVTEITKRYPPDTKAALAWLYNRKPADWHPAPEGGDNGEEAPPVDIHFHVKEPVSDIKITRGKPKA